MFRYCFLFILFSISAFSCLFSYVPNEFLFDDLLVTYQRRLDGSKSNVLLISDFASYNDLVYGHKPVVMKVFAGSESLMARVAYQEVADLFQGRVVFALANMRDVVGVVRMIMGRLQLQQVALPVFMFFSSGMFFSPLLSGTVARGRLIEVVNALFFAQRTFPQDVVKEPLGESFVSRWLSGLHSIVRGMQEYERSRRYRFCL